LPAQLIGSWNWSRIERIIGGGLVWRILVSTVTLCFWGDAFYGCIALETWDFGVRLFLR